MKKIYLLLFTSLLSYYGNGQACVSPAFTNQQQLDNFKTQNPNCTTITGNLIISGSDITNLGGLSGITTIKGDVQIFSNASLTTMNGLGSLTEITGHLTINNNPALQNVDGLEALININNGINVERNESLTSLSGLQSLSHVGGYLRVVYNAALTSIEVFSRITSVTEFLSVGGNPVLESLSGLRNITTANSVSVSLNGKLSSLDGLKSLTSATGYFYIGSNPMLTSLQGLNKLKSINSDLRIADNGALTSLAGLDVLEYARDIRIEYNPRLSECAIRSLCLILKAYPEPYFPYYLGWNATGCNSREEVLAKCTSLPVDLVSFSGENKADGNILNWITASEKNNKGFAIEKSSNGKLFQQIGFVNGNTDSWKPLDYSFTDATPYSLSYYRLKQIDWDETFTYSKIIALKAKEQAVTVYPNPSRGRLTILAKDRHQPYSVKNSQGVTIMVSPIIPDKEISTDTWKNGIYFLTVGSEVFKILVANE